MKEKDDRRSDDELSEQRVARVGSFDVERQDEDGVWSDRAENEAEAREVAGPPDLERQDHRLMGWHHAGHTREGREASRRRRSSGAVFLGRGGERSMKGRWRYGDAASDRGVVDDVRRFEARRGT